MQCGLQRSAIGYLLMNLAHLSTMCIYIYILYIIEALRLLQTKNIGWNIILLYARAFSIWFNTCKLWLATNCACTYVHVNFNGY